MINAATIVVLLMAYGRIRAGDREGHRSRCMSPSALGVAFLAVYLVYHAFSGLAKFGGEGPIRPIYFTLLAIHVVMAFVVAVLVPVTFYNALKARFATHRAPRAGHLPVLDVRRRLRPRRLCDGGASLSAGGDVRMSAGGRPLVLRSVAPATRLEARSACTTAPRSGSSFETPASRAPRLRAYRSQREHLGWAWLAVGALAVAGVFALLLALSRIPGMERTPFWPIDFFYKGLVIHVVFSLVIWLLAIFAFLV